MRPTAIGFEAGRSHQSATREAFMGNVADGIAVKILIGVATAAVWFVLSRAANAEPGFAGPFAAGHAIAQISH
jgi:hypothetical protein